MFTRINKSFSNFLLLISSLGPCLLHASSYENKEQEEESWELKKKDKDTLTLLKKLREGVRVAKQNIERAKGKDCVIIVGQTGVGKSTMANALYGGADSMEEYEVTIRDEEDEEEEKEDKDPATDTHLKPKHDIIREGKVVFGIGSRDTSVTTHPEVIEIEKGDIVLCDCPGFGDTRGGAQGLINCMAIGELLSEAESVQLCLFMTESDLTNKGERGENVRKMLATAYKVFKKPNRTSKSYISAENLRRIRFVITNPTGATFKKNIIAHLKKALLGQLRKDENEIDSKIVEEVTQRLLLIDAKDRSSQFKNSKVENRVEDLLKEIVKKDPQMLYEKSDFQHPITDKAQEEIDIVCRDTQMLALAAIDDEDYEKKLEVLLSPLRELRDFKCIEDLVDPYIKEIKKAGEARKKSIEQEKVRRNLEDDIEAARKKSIKQEKEKGDLEDDIEAAREKSIKQEKEKGDLEDDIEAANKKSIKLEKEVEQMEKDKLLKTIKAIESNLQKKIDELRKESLAREQGQVTTGLAIGLTAYVPLVGSVTSGIIYYNDGYVLASKVVIKRLEYIISSSKNRNRDDAMDLRANKYTLEKEIRKKRQYFYEKGKENETNVVDTSIKIISSVVPLVGTAASGVLNYKEGQEHVYKLAYGALFDCLLLLI